MTCAVQRRQKGALAPQCFHQEESATSPHAASPVLSEVSAIVRSEWVAELAMAQSAPSLAVYCQLTAEMCFWPHFFTAAPLVWGPA